MKRATVLAVALIAVGALGLSTQANTIYTYQGNGDTSFGGAVGQGSLALNINGTSVSGSFTRGSGNFNDVLVLYLDSVAGGIADTSQLTDSGDGLRRAISGIDGGSNRSTLTFPSAFRPDYAIAMNPGNENFGGLWQLVNNSSLMFISPVNLSPTGTASATNFTFSFNTNAIGQPNGVPFKMFGTYISDSGYRSSEAIAGNDAGTPGWNSYTVTNFVVVPNPAPLRASAALLAVLAMGAFWKRGRVRSALN